MILPPADNHRDRKVAADILGGIPEPMEDMVMGSHGTKEPRSDWNRIFGFTWTPKGLMQNMVFMGIMLQLEWMFTNGCE